MCPDEIQRKVEEIARKTLREQAAEIDQRAAWPEEALRALQAEGFGGLTVPKRFGGLGGGLHSMVLATEALGRECGSAAMCFAMHCVGSAVISARATTDQAERFLEPIVKGQHLTTLSLSEPGTGAHFYIPEMKMVEADSENFVLDGSKSFVTNGPYADSYVVSTVAVERKDPVGELSMLVVPNDTEGLKWSEPWSGFGMRGNASSDVEFVGAGVSKKNLLGQPGDQIWYVFEIVAPYFLMAMAGTYLGVAEAALENAIKHVQQRTYSHNGMSAGSVGIVQHKLGRLWSRVESARRLICYAAELGDNEDPAALPAIMSAKAEIGDVVTEVANEGMTLMGGKAYGENAAMARLLRDARAVHVMAPTTDMLRTWTGRALLGKPLLGEG